MSEQEKAENKQQEIKSSDLWYMANMLLEEELYDRAIEKTGGVTISQELESGSLLE